MGGAAAERLTVAIATPLEAGLVERIRGVNPRLEVLYEPELLPPVRFPCDHRGAPIDRGPEGQLRWQELLERAEVLFGLPGDSAEGLTDVVRRNPRLRWVQGTAAGAGEQVRAAGLTREELERVVVTSAAGVHGVPLAEFALLGLLAFTKGLPRLLRDEADRRWEHYAVRELHGATLLVLGLGTIGREVARLGRAFGMHVLGVKRNTGAEVPNVDELYPPERLVEVIGRADGVVVTLPLTPETHGLVGREALARLKPGSVFVNVGRGAVVDEKALVEALRAERIAGAALDVFAVEPLLPESPLWELPNVLVSPHTAALSVHENERIVELFAENLRRYLDGAPLRSVVDPELFY